MGCFPSPLHAPRTTQYTGPGRTGPGPVSASPGGPSRLARLEAGDIKNPVGAGPTGRWVRGPKPSSNTSSSSVPPSPSGPGRVSVECAGTFFVAQRKGLGNAKDRFEPKFPGRFSGEDDCKRSLHLHAPVESVLLLRMCETNTLIPSAGFSACGKRTARRRCDD